VSICARAKVVPNRARECNSSVGKNAACPATIDHMMVSNACGTPRSPKRMRPIDLAMRCCRGGRSIPVLLPLSALGLATAISAQATVATATTLHFTPLLPTPITAGVPLPGRIEARLSAQGSVLVVLDRVKGRLDAMRLPGSGHVTPIAVPRGADWQSGVEDAVLLGDDTLLTLGDDRKEVTLYKLEGSQPSPLHRFRVAVAGGGLCRLHNAIYVLGASSRGIIHEYSLEGQWIRSFGDALMRAGPVLASNVTRGVVLCDDATGLIVIAPFTLNDIRAYTSTGELRWRAQLTDFHQRLIELSGDDGYRVTLPSSGASEVSSIFQLSDTLIGISIQLAVTRDSLAQPATRLIELATGRERGQINGLPMLMAWQEPSHLAVTATRAGLTVGLASIGDR